MSDIYSGAGIFPKAVADLDTFKVRVYCRNCGRLVVLTSAMLSKLDKHLALFKLLARLQCKGNRSGDPSDKGCGGRPDELQIVIEPPPNPVAYRPSRMWVMDRAGEWEERPYDVLDDMVERQAAMPRIEFYGRYAIIANLGKGTIWLFAVVSALRTYGSHNAGDWPERRVPNWTRPRFFGS